ncbi:GIY-YIG nuclease family protein [Candidatus Peregrinibacteria bacterium]|nr:GIY-YIG nuclease family protein [Candidatus Peregrinibacteria bacterium]
MPETYYVYMILCCNGAYYVGVTNDYERRFAEHQNGVDPNAYTYDKHPLELVYVGSFTDIHDAIRWEKEVKGWRRDKKEALIKREWDKLPKLSRRKHLIL